MIRDAGGADIGAILTIWNTVIRDTVITFNPTPKTEDDLTVLLAEKAAAGQAFLVVEQDGAIVGFATYGQFRGGAGYRNTAEHSILLAPQAWGHGHGRALMSAIEDHARLGGAHSIFAGVSAANPAGRAFHAAIGFAEVATLREVGYKYGAWWDLILMQKFLS